MFSDESDNHNPSNYEGVEESKYNLQFLLKQIGSKLIQAILINLIEGVSNRHEPDIEHPTILTLY
ncbi:hypothetical protein T08_12568 [Trichinella sp. T8]|nr:hypothetical protein T08_12568 [Trichinella sp. T8]